MENVDSRSPLRCAGEVLKVHEELTNNYSMNTIAIWYIYICIHVYKSYIYIHDVIYVQTN